MLLHACVPYTRTAQVHPETPASSEGLYNNPYVKCRWYHKIYSHLVRLYNIFRKKMLEANKVLKTKQEFRAKLDSQKPTMSVDKKRAAAKETPLIYHMVSYEQFLYWAN